jgi:hypothetical protein
VRDSRRYECPVESGLGEVVDPDDDFTLPSLRGSIFPSLPPRLSLLAPWSLSRVSRRKR